MVLHLQEYGVEDLRVLYKKLARLVEATFEDPGRYLGGETPGEADDPLSVPLQHLHVHPRLVVEAFEEAHRRELHEVLVAFARTRQEREVVVLGPAAVVPVRRYVDLAAHDGLYAGLLCLLVELDGAVHHAVIGERDAGHALILGEGDEIPDTARPIQHRVLRMAVQMRERCRRQTAPPLRIFKRNGRRG